VSLDWKGSTGNIVAMNRDTGIIFTIQSIDENEFVLQGFTKDETFVESLGHLGKSFSSLPEAQQAAEKINEEG
jgi:hypothetical protein